MEVLLAVATQPGNIFVIGMGVRAGAALRHRNSDAGALIRIACFGSIGVGCVCTILTTAARFPLYRLWVVSETISAIETSYFIIRTCTLPIESLFVMCLAILYSCGSPPQLAIAVVAQCLIKILWSTVGVLAYDWYPPP